MKLIHHDRGYAINSWKHMDQCIPSTVATDSLVLKHQGISIHSADYRLIILDQFHTEILRL